MTTDKGIPVKNIYYMLAYAFKDLKRNNYERIEGEEFENIHDLFAEILFLGISTLLKRGLHHRYVETRDELKTLRGKLLLPDTLKKRAARDTRLVCEFDTFSENNVFNQILKTSLSLLLRHPDVAAGRKAKLRKLMICFSTVHELSPSSIRWNALHYDRNTRTYQMLHSLCFFLLQNRLLTTESGKVKMQSFSDAHMNLLFQRFVMAFYKKRHPECKARAKQIKWDLCEMQSVSEALLPIMQTDITLTLGERTLIIDTKYYGQTVSEYMGKTGLHSPNLYQIHAYVTNEDLNHTGRVDGLLLYAKTFGEDRLDFRAESHDGNVFMAKTLDLSQDFGEIERQLEEMLVYNA